MPAKKMIATMPAVAAANVAAANAAPATAAPATAAPATANAVPGFYQFPGVMQQLPTNIPVAIPVASVPVAAAAVPATAVPAAAEPTAAEPVSATDYIAALEFQMKTLRDNINNMEKALKDAKKNVKGLRKPKAPVDPEAPKKPMPEGLKAWNDYVALIKTERNIPHAEARTLAKQLRDSGSDPRAPAKTVLAAPTTVAATAVHKPKKVLPVAPAPVPVPVPVPAVPEPSEDYVEVEINGTTYLMSETSGGVWNMNEDGDLGSWVGKYDGSKIDTSAPIPL